MSEVSQFPYGRPIEIPSLIDLSCSGVYFLHLKGEIVYVGQARDVRSRIGQHISEGAKMFDAISCIPCDIARLSITERRFIMRLAPRYNSCRAAQSAKFYGSVTEDSSIHIPLSGHVTDEQAAAYLGVALSDIEDWKLAKLLKMPRVARGRVRSKTLSIGCLRGFAKHHADIVEAARCISK